MGLTVKSVVILLGAVSAVGIYRPALGSPLAAPDADHGSQVARFPPVIQQAVRHQHALSHQGDRPVFKRRRRDVTASDDLPRHHGRYLSQPPLPVDDGYNERSMCKWRYEDNVSSNRFPSTLKVAVKVHTGSRCRDPATGAPRADLVCLPIDYELNVLRKDSEGVWQQSVEYVTIGFTCAGSGVR